MFHRFDGRILGCKVQRRAFQSFDDFPAVRVIFQLGLKPRGCTMNQPGPTLHSQVGSYSIPFNPTISPGFLVQLHMCITYNIHNIHNIYIYIIIYNYIYIYAFASIQISPQSTLQQSTVAKRMKIPNDLPSERVGDQSTRGICCSYRHGTRDTVA